MDNKISQKEHLWTAIIAGGQGTRLFPLSHESRPKQFCSLDEENTFIQATVKRFVGYGVTPNHIVVVTTNANQTELAKEQLLSLGVISTNIYEISDHFGYAGAMIKAGEFIAKHDPDAIIINTPSDQYIVADDEFTNALDVACESAAAGDPTILGVKINDLVVLTGCGHALYDSEDDSAAKFVTGFVEKPDRITADELLRKGCSAVNTGINIWSVEQLKNATDDFSAGDNGINTDELMFLFRNKLRVAVGRFKWYDCGTLKSLYKISKKTPNHKNASLGKGRVSRGNCCRGSLFIAEEGTEIIAHAVKDVAIVSSEIEGRYVLTVVALNDSQQVRALAEKYRENKRLLTNDFSVDARNNIVVETEISSEVRFAFVGVDNYIVTPLSGPGGTLIFSVSSNVSADELNLG